MKVILTIGILLCLMIPSIYAEEVSEKKTEVDPAEKQNLEKKNIEICTHNMETIGKAIKAYHKDHGEFPNWLSDLVPKYLADEKVLLCPSDNVGGKTLHPLAKDPNKPVSYDYQLAPKLRDATMRSLDLFGDVTPLIRCIHHNNNNPTSLSMLNLSFDLKVYRAPYAWQNSLEDVYGGVEPAIDALENGLKKKVDIQRVYRIYAMLHKLYMKAERKEDAENLMNRFKTQMDPKNYYHGAVLGDMFKALDRRDEELKLFQELEKHHPKHRFVLQRLENIHKERGNNELALEYRKKYVPGLAFLGKMVPDFEAKDLDGKPISIETYRGKVLLVDFWATWCGPCIADMPKVKKVYDKYKDKGFDILGISLDTDETKLREYLKKNDIAWRQVYSGEGWNSPVSQKYGIFGIPTVWLIDKDGKLISHNARGKLDKLVAEALKEEELDDSAE